MNDLASFSLKRKILVEYVCDACHRWSIVEKMRCTALWPTLKGHHPVSRRRRRRRRRGAQSALTVTFVSEASVWVGCIVRSFVLTTDRPTDGPTVRQTVSRFCSSCGALDDGSARNHALPPKSLAPWIEQSANRKKGAETGTFSTVDSEKPP